MTVIDMRNAWGGTASALTECDLCIVGSGPAGSTIARELSGTGLRVIVLESGGFSRDPRADELNDVENVGRPRVTDQWAVRNRMVGGTSHTWGGRCAPFDAIDFEERSWVPLSGWPFGLADLGSYFDRSAPYLGLTLGRDFSDDRFWTIARRKPPRIGPDHTQLLPFFWQFSRDHDQRYEYMRFGRRLAEQVGRNVTIVTGATVLRINPVASGHAVQSVDIASPDGRRLTIAASSVVVCAGGIENARLLLVSDTVTPAGLGNDRDLVGRYLMDHPRGAIGSFDLSGSETLQRRLGRYTVDGHLFRGGFRLSPEIQRAENLLNCSVWLGEAVAPDDPWEVAKRVVRSKPELPRDAIALAANAGLFLRGLGDYLTGRNGIARKLEALQLDCMCEQRPNPDSRITLSDRRDRFGMRLPRVDWRIHGDEPRTMHRMAELAAEQFAAMGLPPLHVAEWVRAKADFPPDFVDVAHPTGTTRMSDDPAKGVVDANCAVHGVEGLYLAGSSVFPTAGHCNPTQTIVALALRLADHLRSRAAAAARTATLRQVVGVEPRSTRVLVTGATGRIGSVIVADLLERGYLVRATTSKTPPLGDDRGGRLEWRRFDLFDATDYDQLVADCAAVLHIGAEMKTHARMQRSNTEATGFLAEAAERAGVKAFCYTSSIAVYGSGLDRIMTEDAPVLTADRDIRSEYWGDDGLRTYGRTKLGGELALRKAARSVRYVVMRPAVVVGIAEIVGIRDWSRVKRTLAAHRHAHHIYVGDVSDAIIWSMERAIAGTGAPGSIETFNLSEDEFPEPTHADFMRKAFAVSSDRRFRVVKVPWIADWMRDFLRFRRFPLRNPLWRMRYPNDRLAAAGYRPRFGMAKAQALALETIRDEANKERAADALATAGRQAT